MIDPKHLLVYVIRPTLTYLAEAEPRLHSPAAEQLVLGTYLAENVIARTYLKQIGGPALSIYQIEPATAKDILKRVAKPILEMVELFCSLPATPVLSYDKDTTGWKSIFSPESYLAELPGNLYLATALCRLKYWLILAPMPHAGDINGLATYWKRYYNTAGGSGKISTFVKRFEMFAAGLWS